MRLGVHEARWGRRVVSRGCERVGVGVGVGMGVGVGVRMRGEIIDGGGGAAGREKLVAALRVSYRCA